MTEKDELFVDCVLPTPILELTTEKVLVMNFIGKYLYIYIYIYILTSLEGHKLSDLSHLSQAEIDFVVKHMIRSYAFQIFVLGFWNSDPHPGNFLISKINGKWKPFLLDFGLTKVSSVSFC